MSRTKLAYEAQKAEDDPDYLEHLVRNVAYSTVDWTKGVLESPRLGQHMNNMYWAVRDVSDKLFTSDRPVVTTNGLAYDWSNLVMPISPSKAFLVCNTVETMNQLKSMKTMEPGTPTMTKLTWPGDTYRSIRRSAGHSSIPRPWIGAN